MFSESLEHLIDETGQTGGAQTNQVVERATMVINMR